MGQFKYCFVSNNIHSRNEKNAVVMLSGGIDSTIALTWALYRYDHVKAITLDYNQPHNIEIKYAARITSLLGVEHDIIRIGFPDTYWGIKNHLTRGQAGLSVAIAALAISHEGADVVLGILSTDDYRDCDRKHLDSIADVLYHPEDKGNIGIATPLKALKDKKDVIAFGYEIGAPLQYSWSCRNPSGNKPCLSCTQCNERSAAFSKFFADYQVSEDSFSAWQSIPGGKQQPTIENSDHDLNVFAKAFIKSGGFKKKRKGLKYLGPDRKTRIASLIKNPRAIGIKSKRGELCDLNSLSGFTEDGHLWEVCILEDGTAAATAVIPPMDIIERGFIKHARFS